MPVLSILIPARNEKYLQKTIDDILENFESDLEIIVGLDDYWPDPPLRNDPRVIVFHSGERVGMRPMINLLASMANGKYIMKTDAHCAFDKGYDTKLISIYKPGYTVLGIRYELDVENWQRKERTNCDFRYLSNPKVDEKGGLRGIAWHEYKERTKGQEVAETMTISGSGWLMEREQFWNWGGLDENHGTFGQEGCEISCKTWLSGGRVLVNRRTWYAHWNRGKAPYALSSKHRDKSVAYSVDYWLNDRWPLQKYSFNWLLEKFAPVPEWDARAIKTLPAKKQGTILKGYRNHPSVQELWENRLGIAEPLKRERIKIFFDSFLEVIQSLNNGKEYTDEEIEKSRYFQYLRTHLSKEHRYPLTEQGREHILKKFKGGIALFNNVKKYGFKAPLQCYQKDGNIILWKGYRRLVIAHVLGIKKVAIQMHKTEEIAKGLPPHFYPPIKGTIQELGQRQFVKHQGKSTDKYWVHGYLDIYDNLFKRLRDKKIKILEIGVLRGASLALWHEAFPKAQIYGLDKNLTQWKEFTEGLDRVQVMVGMQEDESFLRNTVIPNGPYDIIIDDCGHNPESQRVTFNALWSHLNPHGYYVIEDCYHSYKPGWDGVNIPLKLTEFVNNIYQDHSIISVQFYYNLCVIQKGIK